MEEIEENIFQNTTPNTREKIKKHLGKRSNPTQGLLALEATIETENIKVLELLLEADVADIHAEDGKLLIVANQKNKKASIRCLLKNGDFENKFPNITIAACSCLGETKRVEDLLKKAEKPYQDTNQALSWAARSGHLEICKMLLQAGVDPTIEDSGPLRFAAMNGHPEVLQLLIDAGSNPKSREEMALLAASQNNHRECVNILLNCGQEEYWNSEVALVALCGIGETKRALKIVQNSGNIHPNADKPLRWAAKNGHTQTVKMLLEHGAKLRALNDRPLLWAHKNNHKETTQFILSKYKTQELIELKDKAKDDNTTQEIPTEAISNELNRRITAKIQPKKNAEPTLEI